MDPRPLSHWWKRAVLWSVGGVVFSFGLTWLLRSLFNNTPTWEPEVYTTIAAFVQVARKIYAEAIPDLGPKGKELVDLGVSLNR